MKKLHYLLVVQMLCICTTLNAQDLKPVNKTCGFDKVHKEMMLNDPDYALKTNQFNEQLQLNAHPKGAAPVYQVPVVVHVMSYGTDVYSGYLTDDQIKEGIIELNERYRRVGVGYNTHTDGADVEIDLHSPYVMKATIVRMALYEWTCRDMLTMFLLALDQEEAWQTQP